MKPCHQLRRATRGVTPALVLLGSVLPLLGSALSAGSAAAQDGSASGWNSPRSMELVRAARQVRQSTVVDSTFRSYRSRAQGFVYFFLDRPDEEEHTLIKADQLVLDVFWRSPGLTRQRIVGMRDEKVLPTNIRYHLDHLTVVQDDFRDLIRMGDGDEVAAVIHPVAPGAETVYDYRLTDSLSLNYAGLAEPVRVYQVQVRPEDVEAPGFVGTLYLDRSTGAIVRMAFTFTPASYVDPYLDYIRISLDNALWLGRHWLPYRQEVELRRELPQLDFMAGSIIRGRWEIGRYDFNEDLPDGFFAGPRVTAAPERLRENFDFPDDLYADLDREGLAPSPSLEEIREQAHTMAVGNALHALSPVRLYLSSFSDAVRRNRVEGWRFGLGMTVRSGERPLRILAGYSTAAERPALAGAFEIPTGSGSLAFRGYWNRLSDMGPFPGSSGVVNTLATLGGTDYLDPYWSDGGAVTLIHRLSPRSRLDVTGWLEDHRSATLQVDDENTAFRPVRPVTPGTWRAAEVALVRPDQDDGVFYRAALRGGALDRGYLGAHGRIGYSRAGPSTSLDGAVRLDLGWVSSGAPLQELHLLGGRGTLPGYDYRATVGDRYALVRGWVGRDLVDPWAFVRLTAGAGWSELDRNSLPTGWAARTDPGIRTFAGVGLDLFWQVLRLDVARGLSDGGDWSFYVSVSRRLTPWL